ncbi:MAG TPA: DUF177 domain-containing protein [Ottowia sp.]|nr:DUF177 domain-containing protein [Ottowia sp.]
MSSSFEPRHLDVAAFARATARLSARDSLQKYERLALEVRAPEPDLTLEWQVQGEQRSAADGVARPALHVQASARLPLTCQRCMGEVRMDVQVDRHVLFARDEDSAAALDDVSEDDVLALTPDLDLHALIEDELLMALPLVPRHEVCPQPLRLSAQDADFEAAQVDQQHPFAALAVLKGGKKH